jgi:uncharacterized protein
MSKVYIDTLTMLSYPKLYSWTVFAFLFFLMAQPLLGERLFSSKMSFFREGGKKIMHGPFQESVEERLLVRGNYDRDRKHGLWETWHSNGQLSSQKHFNLNTPINTEKHWASSGNLIYQISYLGGKKDGAEKSWFPSGNLLKEITHWDKGSKEGPHQKWHPNGQEMLRCSFRFDQKHGEVLAWNLKGEKTEESLFQHGVFLKLHIESEKYNNGNMKLAYSFYKDAAGQEIRHGRFNKWFPNGESWIQCEYIHGELEGLWQYGKIDGLHCRQEHYIKGKKHGIFKWFHQGALTKEQVWRDGEMQSERKH